MPSIPKRITLGDLRERGGLRCHPDMYGWHVLKDPDADYPERVWVIGEVYGGEDYKEVSLDSRAIFPLIPGGILFSEVPDPDMRRSEQPGKNLWCLERQAFEALYERHKPFRMENTAAALVGRRLHADDSHEVPPAHAAKIHAA